MGLLNFALRRPLTVIVAVVGLALGSWGAVLRMPRDIFPNLNLPVIYVAQPYGGMDPAQMEGYLVYYYEYHFLYINGIEHVESKSIQNVGLLKLFFHPGTDMNQALAQTVSYVERSRAFMPPGTVPPFIVRFDAGSVPVGQLVFSSETKNAGDVQNLALNVVRPTFATLPGVSAPPPFGGNQRTIVVKVNPERLRALSMSPDEVVKAIASGNTIIPSGNVRTGDLNRIAPVNSVVTQPAELESLPIRTGAGPAVLLRDVATISGGTDIITGYAHVNGRRTVYIPVTKRADASTLAVVEVVKANLKKMQGLLDGAPGAVPGEVSVSFELDQSPIVTGAIRGLVMEGLLGAVLTGLMVLLFLRALRSAIIVVLTIPFALLSSLVGLWLTGQTVNLMTLGGLALAVGILVDEATVAIENIHTHLARGEPKRKAIFEAARETVTPRLLAMFAVVSVFVPSFFMIGVARSLFVPLSLAVGFAMLASYLLSSTLVPVLANWLLPQAHAAEGEPLLARAYASLQKGVLPLRWPLAALYLAFAAGVVLWSVRRSETALGTDIFPAVDSGFLQVRLRAPVGTRVERTEVLALKALETIRSEAGAPHVAITLDFTGVQPPSYPVNTIHLWTSGPQEAVLLVALRRSCPFRVDELQERLRRRFAKEFPDVTFSFEAGDLVGKIMNFGAPTPIEVSVKGARLEAIRPLARRVLAELMKIPSLRDLQFGQPLDYPTLEVKIDRERAGQLGVTVEQIGKALVAATSSSRYLQPTYWRDPLTGIAFQVQVELPQARVSSIEDVEDVPVTPSGGQGPFVRDVSRVAFGSQAGEFDRYSGRRMITITGNVAGSDLGTVAREIDAAISRVGALPPGIAVDNGGQVAPMRETLLGMEIGLGVAIVVIFLMLVAYFQSVRVSLVVILTIPAVAAGVAVSLWLWKTTLNVQSFMGAIMAIGVSVANAILFASVADQRRREGLTPREAALEGGRSRVRPILMTTFAMIAGMVPLATATGEGGEASAPLGRAVIGGLAGSTLAVLGILPALFSILLAGARSGSPSLHPEDTGRTNG
jgi:multidrug efflux pump subunit AcrB